MTKTLKPAKKNPQGSVAKKKQTIKSTKKGKNTSGLAWLSQFSRRTRVYAFVMLFAIVGTIMLLSSFGATPNATSKMGVFRGSGKPDQTAEYEKWLGRPVTYVLDFVGRQPEDSTTPWATIDNPGWTCGQWANTKYSLVLSAAMLPTNSQTLAAGAKGEYNSHWKKFGEVMVNRGCDDAILRLGWEFNGLFFPWSAAGGNGQDKNYAAYWRQIVNTLRSVPGQSFKFDWCPLAGVDNQTNPENAYPGNEYVDIIGLDAYDTGVAGTTGEERWKAQKERVFGLNWHLAFAKKMNKPVSFPEWGITVPSGGKTYGGGDNPYYIQKMYEWMNALPASGGGSLTYHSYFEVDAHDGAHRLMLGQFPNSTAKFKQLFGVLPSTSPTDTTPPSAPASLVSNVISESQVNLSWKASTDNKAVSFYDIYRNSTKISSSLTPSFSDNGLTPGTKYSYYIVAADGAGNISTASNTATATTSSSSTPPSTTTPTPTPPTTSTSKTSSFSATLSKYGSKTVDLQLPKTGTIKYAINNSAGSGRFDIVVMDPSGKTIHTLKDTTLPISQNFTITQTGNYKIKITTKWWSSNPFTLKVTYPY